MNEKDVVYYTQLEKLIGYLIAYDGSDLSKIYESLTVLCRLFNITKGITRFYDNPQYEELEKGEIFVCYDEGVESKEALTLRTVTPAMTIAKITCYSAVNGPKILDEDKPRIQLVMYLIISFLTRNRLQKIVEKLTFYDNDGYRNLNYFFRTINSISEKNEFNNKIVIHFNLKHFALVNQERTRSKGDIVMSEYCKKIENIIGDTGILCRVGGDNFICLADEKKLEELLKVLSGYSVEYDKEAHSKVRVSATCGIYRVPDGYRGGRSGIMDKVMSALAIAKHSETDDVIFYDDLFEKNREKLMHVQALFPGAIKNEEFMVYYQPKVDIYTGKLIGAEALCRWIHEGKLIQPGDFIPVFEQSPDICKLDFYMLDHVCKDIRKWIDEGRNVVRISVNFSRRHMLDDSLLETIVDIIDKNNVPHKYVEIELTETTTDVSFRDLKRIVRGLQEKGIYTSVDDFGMGYSSLNLIRDIPWNVLKVDKSFLPAEDDPNKNVKEIMFKYVIAMSKELGLETITEGVETEKQIEILKDNSCEYAQGFFFDKPLPVTEFEDRLNSPAYEVEKEANDGKNQ